MKQPIQRVFSTKTLRRVLIGVAMIMVLVASGVYGLWRHFIIPTDIQLSLDEDSRVTIDLTRGVSSCFSTEFRIESLPSNGWLQGALPRIVYTPRSNFHGGDQLKYSVTTRWGSIYSAMVRLSIVSVNDSPTVNNRQFRLDEDQQVGITLTADDIDGDQTTITIQTKPRYGTLSGSLPHLIYKPDKNFFGEDDLSYGASDGKVNSQPASVHITVLPKNDPPVALSVTAHTYREFPVFIEPIVNDPDSAGLILEVVTQPAHGILKQSELGFIYRPHKPFIGRDRFSYRAFDGELYSQTAVMTVTVHPFQGAERLTAELKKVINRGGVAIGNGRSGGFIFQSGKYKPASILKLATASAAFHYLGEDARFQTEFYVDGQHNLYIKGYADPSLTTPEWHRIAEKLLLLGVFNRSIRHIVLDDTAIEKGIDFSGRGRTINYFDAPLGALASNYNTAEVNIQPGRQVTTWKNRAPITEITRKRARGLPEGYHRFSIAVDPENGTRYSGELARQVFRQHGLKNRPPIELGSVPVSLDTLYIHDSSVRLKGIVKTMLIDSSNFIANQLLLAMALDRYGEPAQLKQGVRLLKSYLRRKQGLHPTDFTVVEGSGLSHTNRVDLASMLDILNRFKPYQDLLPPLTKSKYLDLIRIGRKWRIVAKTGTMKGVSTLAGFLQLKNREWLPFVIMLEGKPADRARVLKIICRFFGDKEV